MLNEAIRAAAVIVFNSYNTVTVEDAFGMALGEVEVKHNTDLDFVLTEEIAAQIKDLASKFI